MNPRLKKRIKDTMRLWESGCEVKRVVTVLDLKQFGEVLRYHRLEAGISLRDMANRIGCSPAFLSDCELGRRRMGEDMKLLFGYELTATPTTKPL